MPLDVLTGFATCNILNDLPDPRTELQALLELPLDARAEALLRLWSAKLGKHKASGAGPSWESLDSPSPPAPEDDPGDMPSELEDAVKWAAEIACRQGDQGLEEVQDEVWGIVETAFEEHVDQEALKAQIHQWCPVIYARHVQESASWPDKTQTDRLFEALQALKSKGFIVRLNEDYDKRDGMEKIESQWTAATRGAVLLTVQDRDRALWGYGVYLGFCSYSESVSTLEVGREIVAALEQQSLPVHWPEVEGIKIMVQIRWQRRLH